MPHVDIGIEIYLRFETTLSAYHSMSVQLMLSEINEDAQWDMPGLRDKTFVIAIILDAISRTSGFYGNQLGLLFPPYLSHVFPSSWCSHLPI